MIAHLEGQVIWVGEDALILKTQGVGYMVNCPKSIAQSAVSQACLSLWIETLVREDAITLYGFLDQTDQHLFRLLLGVQGVGARVALALLSSFGGSTLYSLILMQDKKELVRAEGVGNKLAERIVLELKDKIARHMGSVVAAHHVLPEISSFSSIMKEAFEVLTSLGYRAEESTPVLQALLSQPNENIPLLENVVREALRALNDLGTKSA